MKKNIILDIISKKINYVTKKYDGIFMSKYNKTSKKFNIGDDPQYAIKDLFAQVDDDAEQLSEILGDFFVECPDVWEQFVSFWKRYCEEQNYDAN